MREEAHLSTGLPVPEAAQDTACLPVQEAARGTAVLLTVAYDGTNYAGWQRQQNAVAVQQKLEEALAALFKTPVPVRAASRTDAGVHALGQRAAFVVDELKIPLAKLPGVINGFLPADIAVTFAEEVPLGFNPRHASRKTYEYKIFNGDYPNPLLGRYSAFAPRRLDVDAMQKAAGFFTGRHDFEAFRAVGGNGEINATREIFFCDVNSALHGADKLITFTVTGSGFLYNMVRIMAGTVLYCGLGKIYPGDIPGIILSRDRTKAGKTMPPEGLTLINVEYTPAGLKRPCK